MSRPMSGLFVEQITVIDCALLDARRGLTGASWIVDVELEGELDAQSMVLDFGDVKKRLKRALDAAADHRLLVPRRATGLRLDVDINDIGLHFDNDAGAIELRSPAQAVVLLDATSVDTAALTAHLLPALRPMVPVNVADIRLHLREEAIDGACYRYTHGLKRHGGDCQRIAHGHRSQLRIRVDGTRDPVLEHEWAAGWADIHLASREDLLETSNGRLRFGYDALQGRFELALPEHRCDLLETDTTVECIAAHIAQACAGRRPGRSIAVRAYEGVMKGAAAVA